MDAALLSERPSRLLALVPEKNPELWSSVNVLMLLSAAHALNTYGFRIIYAMDMVLT